MTTELIAEHVRLPSGALPPGAQAVSLPTPDSERFRPLRCGLVNLYRYDYQEFVFEQGRLLLRGNNGTGKSRVLALTLPFLLDGDVGADRLEPDGDSAKRVEWNLLLGGKHSDRTGYAFIEFGRRDQLGEHFVTLGCGLHAVTGGGLVGKWFFLTKQRVGLSLHLVAGGGYPLGRERLSEAIGASGQVFTNAAQYRREVDQALFQLGQQRYEALLRLLIQLRKPQLSRKLDEKMLSQALSEALSPLPANVLATVADAFRGLEQDRKELDSFRRAQEAVKEFLEHYRRYAQTVTRKRAALVLKEHASYETAQRNARQAESDCDAAEKRLAELDARLSGLQEQERIHEEEIRTLSGRPELADGQRIESERRRTEALESQAERAEADATRAGRGTQEREAACAEAAKESDAALRKVEHAAEQAVIGAAALGLHDVHAEALARAQAQSSFALLDEHAAKQAERTLAQVCERRLRAVSEIRKLNERLKEADGAFARARDAQQERRQDLDQRLTEEAEARDAQFVARDSLASAYRIWSGHARELHPLTADEVVATIPEWMESGQGPSPVDEAVRSAAQEASERLGAQAQAAKQQTADAAASLAALQTERERVASARHLAPTAPHTRDAAARDQRPGAPLWALCDFREDVPAATRANLEAALEAASLLDAWVLPDGRLLDAGTHDTVLTIEKGTNSTRHLGELLVPAIDAENACAAAVSEATVAELLSQIGLGEQSAAIGTSVWIAEDGRFRIGPLFGQWQKACAQHIGEGSRESHRRQRLAQLDAQIAGVEITLTACRQAEASVRTQQEQAQKELSVAPDSRPLLTAVETLSRASRESQAARLRFEQAEARTVACQRDSEQRLIARNELARDLGLSEWGDRLDELRELIGKYKEALSSLWAKCGLYFTRRHHAHALAQLLEDARKEQVTRREHATATRGQATAARRAYELLEQTVGVEFRRIQELLRAAEERRMEVRRLNDSAVKDKEVAIGAHAKAAGNVAHYSDIMARHSEQRARAIAQLQTLAAQRLLSLAVPEVQAPAEEWSVRSAVELGRALEPKLNKIDASDEAWQRLRNDIFQRGKAVEVALSSHGHQASLMEADEVFVVTAQLGERMVSIDTLQAFFDDQIDTRQALLSQREREVLENHLISEVAQELHDRIQQAEALVRQTNKELESRPTTMGIKLRFAWGPGDTAPTGLSDVRKLMLRTVGAWSPADRQTVVAFLQRQIQRAREESPIGTWLEQLSAAFDYRAWHHFVIERYQDGVWQRMTKKSFGTGSGGEKAIGLTLPQFAAAAAHYRSASPHAPRLILLDEVFVGVDREMRGKCMALLRDFDLDFVMTSENEWGCYATLPGVAICHLTARAGIDAVAVSRWIWTGREHRAADVVPPPMYVPDTSPRTSSSDDVDQLSGVAR